MDLGYIYFRIDPEEVVTKNQVVLNMKVHEGDVAYFNDIIIKGKYINYDCGNSENDGVRKRR